MGIRIQKVIGYGFMDLVTEKVDEYTTTTNDPRLNPDGWFCVDWETREDNWTTDRYLEHCLHVLNTDEQNVHFELQLLLNKQFRANSFKDIHRMVSYDDEGGIPSVMVITPFEQPDWCRSDDQIDYYEHAIRFKDISPTTEFVDRPLYPYDNYINIETGETADQIVREWIYQFRNSTNTEVQQMALGQLGCELHWTEKWGSAIPESVIEFCRYTNMFTEDKTIFSMIPLIYTFWS